MSEKLQTRTEHSRSLEDAEKYKALQVLREIGLLKPVAEADTYHGRVRDHLDETTWGVDPKHRNGRGDNGHHNYNHRPTLYTGAIDVAQDFAEARSRRGAFGHPEIHKIISEDADATIIDSEPSFTERLSDEDRSRMTEALEAIAPSLTEGSPLTFDDRDKIGQFLDANPSDIMTRQEVERMIQETGLPDSLVGYMAAAKNAHYMVTTDPSYAADHLLRSTQDISDGLLLRGRVPINNEYLERFFRNAHIVGARQRVDSGTIKRTVDIISYFDLNRVNSEEKITKKREKTQHILGVIAYDKAKLEFEGGEEGSQKLVELLQQPYAKPERLIAAAQKVPGYEKVFDMPTGVWEGFTLAEHTETVLRNFDENFADALPVDLLPVMKLALLSHDIGKPVAVLKGEKQQQAMYNALYAEDFYTKLGVGDKLQGLLLSLIGDGARLAHVVDVRKESHRHAEFQRTAEDAMAAFLGVKEPAMYQISAYIDMARILQTCDGGAYTGMAVTRKKDGIYHRNYPSFNDNFAEPVGLGKRDLKLR